MKKNAPTCLPNQPHMRYYDLDWLRVIAFALLIIYHAGMPFVAPSFHINNTQTSDTLSAIWEFLARLRMPLLFMVAGAGTWYALGKRTTWQFVGERSRRLLIPLVLGTLLIVPPQTYFELKFNGIDYGSYWAFYPHFFDGIVFTGGNFTPNHLWFLYALFFYTMASLPLMVWAKSLQGQTVLARWGQRLERAPLAIYEVMIPIYGVVYWLEPYSLKYIFSFSQWLLVALGFLMISQRVIMQTIERRRAELLMVAVVFQLVLNALSIQQVELPLWLHLLIDIPAVYCLLLAIFGYARHYLFATNAFLHYATPAVLPLYVLHQTFTVAAAYYVVPLDWAIGAKFTVVMLATFIPSLAIYHVLWRPARRWLHR